MPIPHAAVPKEQAVVAGEDGTEGLADLVNPASYAEAAFKGVLSQASSDVRDVADSLKPKKKKKRKRKPEPEPEPAPEPAPAPPLRMSRPRPFQALLPWYKRTSAKIAAGAVAVGGVILLAIRARK